MPVRPNRLLSLPLAALVFVSPPAFAAGHHVSRQTPPTQTSAFPHRLVWRDVLTMEGSGSKKSEPFSVGSRWRIHWKAQANEDTASNFVIFVQRVSDGGTEDMVANVVGASTDSSEEYKAGRYYLSVNSTEPYTITISEQVDDGGKTAQGEAELASLFKAVQSAPATKVKALFNSLVEDWGYEQFLQARDPAGNSVLHYALKRGNKDVVKAVLYYYADATSKPITPHLALAATAGETEVVQALLLIGANINEKDRHGYTALMEAALSARADIVALLIADGADVNSTSKDGLTALNFASMSNQPEKISALLEKAGAKPTNKTPHTDNTADETNGVGTSSAEKEK